ncbi:MAG: glycosyltransferase [Bacillota bacterium]|nr:glycosyltransferase [Bacillota bacterium]
MGEYIEINTKDLKVGDAYATLYEERERIATLSLKKQPSEVTILVQAYNRLEKTKRCVESLLKYTDNVDYDLWLIDNGSTDGTLEYFQSVPYEKKNILHLTDNKGAAIPFQFLNFGMLSEYVVSLANDLVLTKDWLKNLLIVAKSDPQIGMVNPMSSNVSNYQDPFLKFADEEDMQKKAAEFNVSDPRKWHERLRLVTLGTLYTKECFYAIGFPYVDVGFAHNFGDDDLTFRVRRAGYKAILAGDTWIHHDDVKTQYTEEQAVRFNQDLEIGRQNFIEKYNGIDAWEDVNNYINEYIRELKPADDTGKEKVLGINVRCGTPILEIKNHIKKFDVFETECFAHTSDSKFYQDLQEVCGTDHVTVGPAEDFSRFYGPETFDHIVFGDPINKYEKYERIIEDAYRCLKPGGQIFLSIYNTQNVFDLMVCLGQYHVQNPEHAYNISIDELANWLAAKGISSHFIIARKFETVGQADQLEKLAKQIIQALDVGDKNTCLYRLFAQYFYIVLTK